MGRKETVIFAGGCFWCTEAAFSKVDGILSATSGYTAGDLEDPTYEQVCSGHSGHMEAVEVVFDPDKTDFQTVLTAFWHSIDPTDDGGQFADRGTQYQTAIFYTSEEQKKLALASKKRVAKSFKDPIATQILPADEFYTAEEYHQKYYKKSRLHYCMYKRASGRDSLKLLWRGKKT